MNVELAMDDASAPDDDLDFFQFTGARFLLRAHKMQQERAKSSVHEWFTTQMIKNLRFEQQTIK